MRFHYLFLIAVFATVGCEQKTSSTQTIHLASNDAVDQSCDYAINGFSAQKDPSALIDNLRRRASEDSGNSYLEQLGWAYANKARSGRNPGSSFLATKTAECLKQRNPEDLSWKLLQAYQFQQQHQFNKAEKLAAELVSARGGWFDYALYGDALMEQGKLDAAIDAYQLMINLKPGPEAYGRVGHIRWLTGDIEGAVMMLDLAIGSTASHDKDAMSWWRTRLAYYLWQLGHADAALRLVELDTRSNPDYVARQELKGQILVSRAEFDQALQTLSPLMKDQPSTTALWTYYEALLAGGRVKEADKVKPSIARLGEHHDRQTLGLFLATTESDPELALRIAQSELKHRQDVFTLDLLAWSQLKQGNTRAALTNIKRAMQPGIQHPRIWLHAAIIFRANGQPGQARQFAGQAMSMAQLLQPSEQTILSGLIDDLSEKSVDNRLALNSFLNHKELTNETSN